MLDATVFALGDQTYKVRPLFPALDSISGQYGGILGAVARVEAYDARAMAWIIAELLAANGDTLQVEVIGERMMEKGLQAWATPILDVLTKAIKPRPEKPVATGDTKSAAEAG